MVVTGRIPHLPSMVAILCKSCLFVSIPGLHELSFLFNMRGLRRDMVRTAAHPTVSALSRKVESESSLPVESAEAMGLTTCAHAWSSELVRFSDVHAVPVFLTTIFRRGSRFGQLIGFLATSVHCPSSLVADFC